MEQSTRSSRPRQSRQNDSEGAFRLELSCSCQRDAGASGPLLGIHILLGNAVGVPRLARLEWASLGISNHGSC